jgi:hypothetical protein
MHSGDSQQKPHRRNLVRLPEACHAVPPESLPAGRAMGLLLRWSGILLGAIALFSFVHKRFAFALAHSIQNALDHYRSSLHPLAERFSLRLGIPGDLIIVYFLFALLLLWFYIFDDLEWSQSGEDRITLRSLLGRIAIALAWPIVLPAAMYLIIFSKNESSLKSWWLELTKVLIAFVILFGANSYLTTLL